MLLQEHKDLDTTFHRKLTKYLEQYYNEKVIDCVSEKRQISNSIKIDI